MFLYLTAVSGVMIHLHYCGQQLESWSVNQKTTGCGDDACGDETAPTHNCCKDKVIAAKITKDQNSVTALKLKLSGGEFIVPTRIDYYREPATQVFNGYTIASCSANAPPGLWQQLPLYALHGSLTYYG